MNEQEANLQRRIEQARVVPDVAGQDCIGNAVVFLANGQPLQPQVRERSPYFVISRA